MDNKTETLYNGIDDLLRSYNLWKVAQECIKE